MKIYTLKRKQTFTLSLQEVFEFFGKPENLEKITPRSVGFHILTPRPIEMKIGTVLDYIIRLFGIPVRWTTLISEYDPPNKFSDVAIRGPYSFWFHNHNFEEIDGNTVMTDKVSYALPFGFIGRLAHFFWVKRQLNYIFDYRAKVISDILENKKLPASVSGKTDSNQENI